MAAAVFGAGSMTALRAGVRGFWGRRGLEFRVVGFGVQGLEFWVLGVWGLKFKVHR